MDDLTRLALAARHGDRAALARFVRATQPDVFRLCRALSRPDLAEDLTQETYARACAALGRFRGESSAKTWLLAIARNVAADAIRRQGTQRRLLDRLGAPPEVVPGPGALVDAADLLAGLDPDRRAAFALTQVLGLSYAEAAEVLGCPVGTVRSRVSRAREDLVAAVRDAERREPGAGTGVG